MPWKFLSVNCVSEKRFPGTCKPENCRFTEEPTPFSVGDRWNNKMLGVLAGKAVTVGCEDILVPLFPRHMEEYSEQKWLYLGQLGSSWEVVKSSRGATEFHEVLLKYLNETLMPFFKLMCTSRRMPVLASCLTLRVRPWNRLCWVVNERYIIFQGNCGCWQPLWSYLMSCKVLSLVDDSGQLCSQPYPEHKSSHAGSGRWSRPGYRLSSRCLFLSNLCFDFRDLKLQIFREIKILSHCIQ